MPKPPSIRTKARIQRDADGECHAEIRWGVGVSMSVVMRMFAIMPMVVVCRHCVSPLPCKRGRYIL